jgi:hypothetical protein
VFSRLWARVANQIEIDKIILVDGHVDNQDAEPKVRVDNITTNFTRLESTDSHESDPVAPGPAQKMPAGKPEKVPAPASIRPARVEIEDGAEFPPLEIDDPEPDWDSMPPMPEFPTGDETPISTL